MEAWIKKSRITLSEGYVGCGGENGLSRFAGLNRFAGLIRCAGLNRFAGLS
jgi:hypothetical protein